jgi:protocatechuate 3,4-dioxygenase beta subunit
MAKTTTVTVKVTNEAGKPVAGQPVYLEPTGSPIGKWSGSGTTDAQGRAVIEGVPPGEYQLTDRSYPRKDGPEIHVEEGRAIETEVKW